MEDSMVQLAFYKVPVPSSEDWQTRWASRIINWATGMRGYFHCELVFADNQAWTALMHGGTRFFQRLHPLENWTVFELPMTAEQEAKVLDFCRSHCDIPYDLLGAIGISLGFLQADKQKMFCSQACILALQTVGIFENLPADEVSPNFLFEICTYEKFELFKESGN